MGFKSFKPVLTTVVVLSSLLQNLFAANMIPVSVTGFNGDLVVENTAGSPSYFGVAVEFNPGETKAFYQSGLPGKTRGLPVSGNFVSAVGDTTFQLQPYTGPNALLLSTANGLTSGTLTLVEPAPFARIAVIASSASGGGTPEMTLNFQDGSSFTTNYNAQDWFFNPNFALQGFERIHLNNGSVEGGSHSGPPNQDTRAPHLADGAANDPRYNRYSKISSIRQPGPAKLWVLIDESEILLNDGAFGFSMLTPRWVDGPGQYHADACGFSFADGHSEIKKWRSSRTGKQLGNVAAGSVDEQDYLWMRERTSAEAN